MTKPLAGKIAVVAGATRGAGRGIATALGEAGATVYCTGRSVAGSPGMKNRPETIQETAEIVTARGGHGIAVRVDHTIPERRSRVCSSESASSTSSSTTSGAATTWSNGARSSGRRSSRTGSCSSTARSRRTSSRATTACLACAQGGLVVEITDGDGYFYRGHFFYDLVKTTVIRMAFALSQELKERGITALAVTPGFLRSEWMLDHFGVTEANWRDAAEKVKEFIASETPLFVGRCVAALAADRNVKRRTDECSRPGISRRSTASTTPTARDHTSCAGCRSTCLRSRQGGRSWTTPSTLTGGRCRTACQTDPRDEPATPHLR